MNAETHPMVSYQRWWKQAWRAVCIKRCMHGSGKGDWKRIEGDESITTLVYHNTSLVAYST